MKKNFLIVLLLILSAAACTPHIHMKDMRLDTEIQHDKSGEIDYLIEPHESVGLKVTPSLKEGNVSVYRSVFPEIQFGEYYPGRSVWYGVVVDGKKEYFLQAVFVGIDRTIGAGFSGTYLQNLVIDGNPSPEAKGIVFSTSCALAYDLEGEEIVVEKRSSVLGNFEARKAFVEKHGTPLKSIHKDNGGFKQIISNWNVYDVPGGSQILSPLGEKEVKEIAAINPQYNFAQKLIGSGRFVLSPDYVGTTVVSLGIDVFRAANGSVPATGWDYLSELPNRRQMAFLMKYVGSFRLELIRELNRVNIEILRKCGGRYGEEKFSHLHDSFSFDRPAF